MLRLELVDISKQYPAVKANDRVCLHVEAGEIHAILGENGAGKSTLMKIIYGVTQPDAGQIIWNGTPVKILSPAQARQLGISMVFQHFSLFETLSVAENVWLGLDKSLKLSDIKARIEIVSQNYGLPIDPSRPVYTLSVGERQRVEIIRALLTDPKLLILDEPTSVLTPQAVESLFQTLRQLADEGCSILYISHKLHEIRALCSACTVLRAGQVTGQVDPRQESNYSLSKLMIGAEPPKLEHQRCERGGVQLRIKNLSLPAKDQFSVALSDINLDIHRGEIVGIAGVSGNGQRELLEALSGEDSRTQSGKCGAIILQGEEIQTLSVPKRRKRGLHGMHFVPEERLGRGTVPLHTLAQNMLLTRSESVSKPLGVINYRKLNQQAADVIKVYNVKASGPSARAESLSGGNLQKYIMGREMSAKPKVLIVAQPTWGVDAGASTQIRSELLNLRNSGCAVLVVSEELEELFEISDRLYVMASGQISPSLAIEDATMEKVGTWMSGLWDDGSTHHNEQGGEAYVAP